MVDDVYRQMTDEEVEYSLKSAYDAVEDSLYALVALESLRDTRVSGLFDRLVLGIEGSLEEDVDQALEESLEEYTAAFEEARRDVRDVNFERYEIDEDELTEDIASQVHELAEDRVGLSGLARSVEEK